MELPKRKNIRLQNYDYSSCGAYFVTICTLNRQEILAEICRGGALLLPIGEICKTQIDEIQKKYNVIIDKYVIMPNHIHLIICINLSENYKPVNTTINKIIENIGYKINRVFVISRSYHDNIIRNEQEYQKISEYIDTNPMKWEEDCFYTKCP